MRSDAPTVNDYLRELPDERRAAIEAVREVVLDNLPDGYVEAMNWGMISYEVPLERSGKTYNGKPLDMRQCLPDHEKRRGGRNARQGLKVVEEAPFTAGTNRVVRGCHAPESALR